MVPKVQVSLSYGTKKQFSLVTYIIIPDTYSARPRYILVLKTRDCIDVKQENAYGNILLRETSKLESLNLDKEE
ncbi:hypothetical protein ACJIZ3_011231 [Penstemon smallii]|uniref:Rad21/Rec8-like protein C-terminal eukaryotic domain-containing protein n=1 Tax=Penstemon smallii TaxID=265156 RepID=A0ABD3UIJ0_9LAMI